MAAFRGDISQALPPSGRSSDESVGGMMSSYLSRFGSVSPVVDFQLLESLKYFWLYNPDVSQYVANIVNLGNPGHEITVEAATDARAEAALNRVNESASRIYTIGCGVDGLLNQYLTSIAWSGAISSEDVVNLAMRRVEKVVLVPVEQIRFKYNKDLDIYEPYQRSANLSSAASLGLTPLNPETYKYLALSTVENSPYAKPPATAAVEAILTGQEPLMANLRYMIQKVGLMGFVALSAVAPQKSPNETPAEYQARCQAYLANLNSTLDGNLSKGMITTFRDQKVEHTPVTTGAAGVAEINQISEQQVMSGVHQPPVFFGRTDSSTETFADVVYSILIAQVANVQRIAKRRQEMTYRLDLRLGGIDVDSVSLSFNKAHSRNLLGDAQTEEVNVRNVISKVEKGIIAPDQGAQELGYDTWFDVEALAGQPAISAKLTALINDGAHGTPQKRKTLRMSFDKAKQRYVPQREVLSLAWAEDVDDTTHSTVVPFVKKKANLA